MTKEDERLLLRPLCQKSFQKEHEARAEGIYIDYMFSQRPLNGMANIEESQAS